MNQLYIGGFRPDLESVLIEQIKNRASGSRINLLTVVVPHPLLGRYLSRLVASNGINTFGLKFISFQNFQKKLVDDYLARSGFSVLPQFAEQILVQKIISNSLSDLKYLSKVGETKGVITAFLAWIYECGSSCVSRDELIQLYETGIQGSVILKELLFLTHQYFKSLAEKKLISNSEIPVLSEKSLAQDLFEQQEIYFYGFYHFKPAQRNLLERLSDKSGLTIFFPYQNIDEYQYSIDSLNWLNSLCSESVKKVSNNDSETTDLISPIDIVSAPNVEAESEVILSEIFSNSENELWDCCVLTRKPNAINQQWRDLLSQSGFRGWFQNGRPLIETEAGRSLQLLIKLIQGKFRRDLLLDFLSHSPLNVKSQFESDEILSIQSDWEILSKKLGIREYLKKNKEELLFRKNIFLKLNQKSSLPLSENSIDFFFTVLDSLQEYDLPLQESGSLETFSKLFERLLKLILNIQCEGMERVFALFEDLKRCNDHLSEISYGDFLATLLDILNGERITTGSYEKDGVSLCGIISSYGVQWKDVFIPCLQSGVFENFDSGNSIFRDNERKILNSLLKEISNSKNIGFEFETQKFREEKLLFRLALESASNKLVLSYHRFESGMSREEYPSNSLLQLCRSLNKDEALENPFHFYPKFRMVGLDHFYNELPENNLIDSDFNLSLSENGLQSEVAASYLNSNYKGLIENSKLDRSRISENFTEYDSAFIHREVLGKLKEADSPFSKEISVSRLENYATCPFQFYLNYILGLNEEDEPEWLEVPSRLEEGSLVHLIYEQFFKQLKVTGGLSEFDTTNITDQINEVQKIGVRSFENRKITGVDLLWSGKKKTIDRDLKKFITQESEFFNEWEPLDFEIEFNRNVKSLDDYPYRAIKINLTNGKKVYIGGKIDRCDRKLDSEGQEKIKVIDYKTGKKPGSKKDLTNIKGALFDKGQKLQLPIYIMAAESIFSDSTIEEASYKFSTHRGEFTSQSFDASALKAVKEELIEIIETVCENWDNGNFIQVPGSHCTFCPYKGGACEDGRDVRAEKKEGSEKFRDFLKIQEIENRAKEKLKS